MQSVKGIIRQTRRLSGQIKPASGGGGGGGGGEEVRELGEYTAETVEISSHAGSVVETAVSIEKNIGLWTKNIVPPEFNNTYADGKNHLLFTGGAGYERIYMPVTISGNGGGRVELDYKTEGYSVSSAGKAALFAVSGDPGTGSLLNMAGLIGYVWLDNNASETAEHYVLDFSGTGEIYIGIDFGYVNDGVQAVMDFDDITCISRDITYT